MRLPGWYSLAMIRTILVPAPAKINLHLAVGGARADGFHSIASIFQAISMQDQVRLELVPGGRIELDCACDCPPEKNTAYIAAKAFFETSRGPEPGVDGRPAGLAIHITKVIPAGAGLGGGSSDAAATLAGLSALFPGALSRAELMRLAAGVGSDVPFFLGSACAAVTGRGEVLAALRPRGDYALVVIKPGFSVSTKEAYHALDRSRAAASSPVHSDRDLEAELQKAVAAYHGLAPSAWPFRNDFYDALLPGLPELARCRKALLDSGAAFAAMSGSGSAVFGVFGTEDAARLAAVELARQYDPIIAFPLARLPDSI